MAGLDDVDQLAKQFNNIKIVMKKPVDLEELQKNIRKIA